MSKDTSGYRKDTTESHALFEGNIPLYYSDQEWRKDIPKSGGNRNGVAVPSRPGRAQLSWGQRR
jgi:hypothetical protein